MDRNTSFVAAALAAATFGFSANADDPLKDRADPPRWFVPADTPAQKYAVAMKEAGAALKEALADCAADGAHKKECAAEARTQWRQDVAAARGFLSTDASIYKPQ